MYKRQALYVYLKGAKTRSWVHYQHETTIDERKIYLLCNLAIRVSKRANRYYVCKLSSQRRGWDNRWGEKDNRRGEIEKEREGGGGGGREEEGDRVDELGLGMCSINTWIDYVILFHNQKVLFFIVMKTQGISDIHVESYSE